MNPATLKSGGMVFTAAMVCLAGLLWTLLNLHPGGPPAVATREIRRQDLVQKDGRWYQKGETNLFSGWMVDRYPGGQLLTHCQIADGLLSGISEGWYTNGQIQIREHFKNGMSDGLREKWHENGQKASEAVIVNGKVTGTFRSWHDNGQLYEQIEMKSWVDFGSGSLPSE